MCGLAITSLSLAPALVACSSGAPKAPSPFDDPVVLPPRDEAGAALPGSDEPGATPQPGARPDAGDGGIDAADANRPMHVYPLSLALDGLTVTLAGATMTNPYFEAAKYWGPDATTAQEFAVTIVFNELDGQYSFSPRVEIRAFRPGAGCAAGDNGVTYRNHEGSYSTSNTSACGLTITSLPRARGERFSGTFSGILTNYVTGKTKSLAISFGFTRSS